LCTARDGSFVAKPFLSWNFLKTKYEHLTNYNYLKIMDILPEGLGEW
jgi:hypothetical protein